MFKKLLLVLGSILSISSYAQQLTPDSLESRIANTQSDGDKIIPLSSLCIYYYSMGDPKGLEYAQKATSLARQQKDHKYGVYAYSSLSAIYADMDSISKAYVTIDTCMWYIENTTDVVAKISGLNSMVIVKEMFNEKESIPDLLLQALSLVEHIDPEKQKERSELNIKLNYSLYQYYIDIDPILAKKYLDISLAENKKIDAPILMIQRLNAYWAYYKKEYEKKKDRNILDSAFAMSNAAMSLYHSDGERIAAINFAETLYDRADLFLVSGQLDSATFYASQLIDFTNKISDMKTQVGGYHLFSKIELKKRNFDKAEEFELKALKLVSPETGTYEQMYEMYLNLSDIYELSGAYKPALEARDKAFDFFKKKNDESYMREAQIAEAKLKVQQNRNELEETKRQNQAYFFYILLSGILLIALILLLIIYWLRLKNGKQKEQILLKDREEAQLYAELKLKETLSLEIEKENVELLLEIEKTKARLKAYEVNKLQKELLVGNVQLDYKNEIISQIKNSLADKKVPFDTAQIEYLLREESRNDANFEEFTEYVKKIHPQFYFRLQEHAQQKLTPLDLKYCTFIVMNLSTKDIASLLYIEPKTVRMTKYRLKQKLGLSKEDDLNLFIQQVIV